MITLGITTALPSEIAFSTSRNSSLDNLIRSSSVYSGRLPFFVGLTSTSSIVGSATSTS
jgi:hypothetical protein